MDEQSPHRGNGLWSEVAHLRERMKGQETKHQLQAEWLSDRIGRVERKIEEIDKDSRLPTGSAGVKLIIAMLIPLAVYLLTGSVDKAKHAATLLGGGG